MYFLILLLLVLFFIWSTDKRLKQIEENRGYGYPVSFYIRFGISKKLIKIVHDISSMDNKLSDYQNWNQKDKDKLTDLRRKILNGFSHIWFTYLPSDNAWHIRFEIDGKPYSYMSVDDQFIFSHHLGDNEKFNGGFSLRIHQRSIQVESKMTPVLTAYLTTHPENYEEESDYYHLFDFPFTDISLSKKLGFKSDSYEGGYYGPNPDYAIDYNRGNLILKKDGIEINI